MQSRASVRIARSQSEIFGFIAEPANDRLWRGHLVTSHGHVTAAGDRVTQSYEYQGNRKTIELEVTEYAPPERLTYALRHPIAARFAFQCRAEDGGTRVSAVVSAELTGPAALFAGRAQSELEKTLRSDLERLKQVLEARGQV